MTHLDEIVISGTGIITSLGRGRTQVFDAICAGRVGLGPMPSLEQRPDPDLGGGQAVEIASDPSGEELDRAIVYLRAAVLDALADSELQPREGRRVAVVLGSTLHGMRSAGRYLRTNRPEELRSFLAGSVLEQAIRGLGIGIGPIRMTTCAACSSGLSSVGLGMLLLRSEAADVVVTGGYDTVSEYAYAGFNSLRLISPEPLRPFGADRMGMKVAEGYGVLVLERAADAAARGGTALAVVGGYGESSDSFHLTQPLPDGRGAADAIEQALGESGLAPRQIGLISAHATGTLHNDAAEYLALRRAIGDGLAQIPVVGFKGSLGHTLGGAGAVELILSLEAMMRQCVPPTPGAARVDPDFTELRLAPDPVHESRIDGTLNLSLGFGGSNTAVVLRSPRSVPVRPGGQPETRPLDPVITGVGIVLPETVGFRAFCQRLRSGERQAACRVAESEYASLLTTPRLRRVSEYAKLSLAAASDACRHASFESSEGRACSAILGTTHGSPAYCEQYYRQIVDEGMAAANPVLFAEGVPNAAAAHLSMGLGLRGGCQTLIGTRTAGLEALILAGMRVREGRISRCVVVAAEEYSEVANLAHTSCGTRTAPEASAGAVAFLVESLAYAESRGATILANLGRFGWGTAAAHTAGLWQGILGKPPVTWVDIPGVPLGEYVGAADGLRSVSELFPEMYSVSSLVAVAAILAEAVGPAAVVSGDASERVCGMGLSVCKPSTGSGERPVLEPRPMS